LTALWNELWEQRLKLDIQAREAEKLTAKLAEEIVAANPDLKTKLATEADTSSFVSAVETMSTKLVDATQKKAEQATLDKAEAGIFELDAASQAEFDKT
jgi:predicted GTPase